MTLTDWNCKLEHHFAGLRDSRGISHPVFALEHGLTDQEVTKLSNEVREYVSDSRPSRDHSLVWVVYAAELGYRFSGEEYWQTFNSETPGWDLHCDNAWLRDRFQWFQRKYKGAIPSGPWAENFSIICWPIRHAILPRDHQKQLAKVLYELRGHFNAGLLKDSCALGELIARWSVGGPARFEKLTEDHELVGLIALALLLNADSEGPELLLPATLHRIAKDLEREQSARRWLKDAQRVANRQVQFGGFSRPGQSISGLPGSQRQDGGLGIEPRLILCPSGSPGTAWDVHLEVPDLSHLMILHPAASDTLRNSRIRVNGSKGPYLARGRLLYGSSRVKLTEWPDSHYPLIQFEPPNPGLEALLKTECLLRPGDMWLFKVREDGLAVELRGHQVRPGGRYVLLKTGQRLNPMIHVDPCQVSCTGVSAIELALPSHIDGPWTSTLETLNLSQHRKIDMWPVGIPPAAWDGEGKSDWLTTDQPRIALRADHPLRKITLCLNSSQQETLCLP